MPRIAFVADIHHGADHFTKKGSAALTLLAEFAAWTNAAEPDLVIDLGDRISDRDRDHDLRLEAEAADAFRAVRSSVQHLCGNHDRDFLSVEDNERLLGQALGHATIDLEGWRIVLWRADSRIRRGGAEGHRGFLLAEADLLWLAGVLRTADRPLLVASHVPVSLHSQAGNYYFERDPGASTYPEAARLRAELRACRQPVVWVSGHVHWNTATLLDGIPHLTLQSLTETFTTHPDPAASMGLLDLGRSIDWAVEGTDAFRFSQPTEAAARRWVTPLAPSVATAEHALRLPPG